MITQKLMFLVRFGESDEGEESEESEESERSLPPCYSLRQVPAISRNDLLYESTLAMRVYSNVHVTVMPIT